LGSSDLVLRNPATCTSFIPDSQHR
jgi:hypothetical protein